MKTIKIKLFGQMFESNDVVDDEIYIKQQREEDTQAQLQSYIDMFNDDPNYRKYNAEERYTQICRDFIMTDDMKNKFKNLVFKKTYEKLNRIKTFKQLFENATEEVQEIVNTLHQISLMFETYHHNTLSTSKHNSLGKQYEIYDDIKDDIIEKIIGYSGIRYNKTNTTEVIYSIENLNVFPKFIIDFAKKVEEFAKSNNYHDVENLAQELSGIGAKLTYLLTLNDINEAHQDTLDLWKKKMVDKDVEIYREYQHLSTFKIQEIRDMWKKMRHEAIKKLNNELNSNGISGQLFSIDISDDEIYQYIDNESKETFLNIQEC